SDLAKSLEPSVPVTQRGDNHIGPETAAVLADTPAFVFKASVLGREFEFLLGLASFDVLLCVETGKMLADDFLAFPSLQFFRGRVPGEDTPLDIQQYDSVILYLIYQ